MGCVPRAEEIVERGRCHPRAHEHGVRLPAVVDLVLEQVCEQPAEGVGLRPGPAQDADRCVQIERPRMGLAAECDQARVDVPLSLAERRTGGEGRLRLEERAGPLVWRLPGKRALQSPRRTSPR